ncbi:MAG: DEAD/DEAH box helicase family protein [Bacillota bacterium]|nr:DEAD/DEAH box helicase family protein [Bacillota bacterium]
MNFRDIQLKYSYESEKDDLLWDFYIPMLSYAQRYDRITGFFSSTSLALAARGLAALIERGGKMRLITCPRLSKEDADIINIAVNDTDSILSKRLIYDLSQVQDQFQHDHISALGWMLAEGYLQIKIALVYEKGKISNSDKTASHSIMHQKVGILYDEDFNGVSFSGSNNESASGWLENIEEFKVFKQWEPGQKIYFTEDQNKFEDFWDNKRAGVRVVDLPTAVYEKLIETGADFSKDSIALKKYYTSRHRDYLTKAKQDLKLFFYQKNAVNKWEDSNKRLLLEMATGCGKTRTAIGCMQELLRTETHPVLAVIACPQNILSIQWKNDIESLNTSIDGSMVCDGTIHNWRASLDKEIKKLSSGFYRNLVIYTTHQTCSDGDFVAIINGCSARIMKFFIGDEVHGMGAAKTRQGLLESYQCRLGLSATPSRWFDDEGSKLIEDYFGNVSFKFNIQDALTTINPITSKTFLVNYRYHPHFINLTDDELSEYKQLSDKITKISQIHSGDSEQALQFLLFRRAELEKNAENKYSELELILDEIGNDISDTIIFVSDDQIDRVMRIMGRRNITAHRFTQAESTIPSSKYGGVSEREYLIKRFISGEYMVLVAIKCLDEGIDIPSAKRAIVMASSTNPREYIQRIGRIIRQAPGKNQADIYDLIIRPDLSGYKEDIMVKLERKIFEKEMERVKDLSVNALNNSSVLNLIYKILGGIV